MYGSQCESPFCMSYSYTEERWWISSQNTPVAPKLLFFFSIPHITYGNLGKSWLADVQVNFCGHGEGLS